MFAGRHHLLHKPSLSRFNIISRLFVPLVARSISSISSFILSLVPITLIHSTTTSLILDDLDNANSKQEIPFSFKIRSSPIAIFVAADLIPAALALPRQHVRHIYSHNEPGYEEGYAQHTSKRATSGTIALDSHVEYSSSMGVIGCLINTNRVAYFPTTPPCSNPCIKLTAPNGNTINVLHIDQSGGSYDISMDAYKTLKYGADWKSMNALPEAKWDGVTYEYVFMDQCADILPQGTLPVLAKSPNKYVSCAASEPQSFWATHTQFYDVDDARCLRGVMQTCEMVPPNNTPTCANGKMAGMSGHMPLTGVDTVVDVTAAGEQVPAIRPAV